jgi:hypothetical protein
MKLGIRCLPSALLAASDSLANVRSLIVPTPMGFPVEAHFIFGRRLGDALVFRQLAWGKEETDSHQGANQWRASPRS